MFYVIEYYVKKLGAFTSTGYDPQTPRKWFNIQLQFGFQQGECCVKCLSRITLICKKIRISNELLITLFL